MRINPSISISQFTGINERADPVRVGVGKGKMPFVDAVNLDIDDSGMMTLRAGYVLSLSGNFDNLWSKGDICLFNDRGTLKSLSPDLRTFTTILSGLNPTAPISYVPVNNDVFLTNNSTIGYIRAGAFNYLTDPGETFKAVMPAGHLIEYFNSRLYVARDNVIVYSDPATCQYYDKRHNFYWLSGRVSMMKAVSDGIFVSDSKATYFAGGASPTGAVLVQVCDYPANEDSVVAVDAENIGLDKLSGSVLIWSSPKGICLGAKEGQFINLTHEKMQLYQSSINASLLRTLPGKTQYIFLSEIQEVSIEAEPLTISTRLYSLLEVDLDFLSSVLNFTASSEAGIAKSIDFSLNTLDTILSISDDLSITISFDFLFSALNLTSSIVADMAIVQEVELDFVSDTLDTILSIVAEILISGGGGEEVDFSLSCLTLTISIVGDLTLA